ncbi:hypothetical protein MOQ_007605 [Trypanosoma cruzi marinkellei]|uniref:Uncharacterized protein n=1 Tax=Trypanosoma cruzi marinkellei TaxID=85056 RepID=K2MNG0_TRYCR|nr:hypothetical protein MOQ_007605 [Trypanosoma cruzi marinkellei]
MEHRHRRIGRKYYLCPTAQGGNSPVHCSRRLGAHVHGIHYHSWGRGCTGPPPHRSFAQMWMAATTTATRHPMHMPSLRPGCRTAGTPRTSHGNASSSRWTPPRHDPTPGRLPGVRQPPQPPHGVARKASRNLISSLAPSQARPPPTNRRRCREYDGVAASTPFECTYCDFRARAKAGPLSCIRAHEHFGTEPRSAPMKKALHKSPLMRQAGGQCRGLTTHTRHNLSDGEKVTKPKMEVE